MIDSIFEVFRKVNREHLHDLWQRAQNGELEGVTEEEERLAKIMLDHSDEYFNQFEFADVLADREFDPESEANPFLHVTLHAVAEKQVQDRDPIEAFQFYNAMLRNKCTKHEAIHLLSAILIKFIFPILKERGRFSLDSYRNLLKKYKSRKPEKIFALLETEPDPIMDKGVDSKSAEIFDEMSSALKDQNFRSIEEAQAFVNAWQEKKNVAAIPEFLGLTPEQMHRILHQPFKEVSDIVTFNRNLSKEELIDIPVVKETMYFLKRLSELQPLKSTTKGNLPQAFAREMHDKFPGHPSLHYPIRSEEEDSKLSALRHLLEMAGWIKKRNQKFSLTQKGQNVVGNGFCPEDFYHLLKTYTRGFNWAFRDHYPSLEIIQQGFLFSCYLLHQKAKTYIPVNELSTCFIQAFPAVLNLVGGYPSMEPEELVGNAFCVRLIERFCEYFGLVRIKREEKSMSHFNYYVQISPLFEKIFNWKLDSI
jgi:hypothetical protein